MNDGLFEVLLVRGVKASTAPAVFNKLLRQDYTGDKIMLFKTNKLKITATEEVPWTLDGEYGGAYTDMDIEVQHKAIRVVSPDCKYI